MSFAQLTYRESLRDIVACLKAMQPKLYHIGIRGRSIARSTLADANEKRDWRIYADFAQMPIHTARKLYINEDFGVQLDDTVYALDSSTIDLCLSLFPMGDVSRSTKAPSNCTRSWIYAAISLVYPDHRRESSTMSTFSTKLFQEPRRLLYYGSWVIWTLQRLFSVHRCMSFFVTRTKTKVAVFSRLYSRPSRQVHRVAVRPVRCADRFLPAKYVSREDCEGSAISISKRTIRSFHLSGQQL